MSNLKQTLPRCRLIKKRAEWTGGSKGSFWMGGKTETRRDMQGTSRGGEFREKEKVPLTSRLAMSTFRAISLLLSVQE
jgi:hypothetical protein